MSVLPRLAEINSLWTRLLGVLGKKVTDMGTERFEAELGRRLTLARHSHGTTLDKLSIQTGIPQSTVESYEAGLLRAPALDLVKMCRALGISVQSLFPEEEVLIATTECADALRESIAVKLKRCDNHSILTAIDILVSSA